MTLKAAVVGWPVEHALSPVLHCHWLTEYGIAGTYEGIAIAPGTFAQRIAELRDAGYRGVNVTVPYKEEAFALAQRKNQAAQITGAANLLVFTQDGDIEANNTDAFGLADSLEEKLGHNSMTGRNVVLLGAGGAARGAAFGLHRYGAAKITILNRNKDRADQLAAHLGKGLPDAKFETGTLEDWSDAAPQAWLVVNTTSAGMKGNPELNINVDALPHDAAVCDIVYNPLQTRLLKNAAARGLKTIDGLGMLMYQAKPSFEAFFGKNPDVTDGLRTALVEALQNRG